MPSYTDPVAAGLVREDPPDESDMTRWKQLHDRQCSGPVRPVEQRCESGTMNRNDFIGCVEQPKLIDNGQVLDIDLHISKSGEVVGNLAFVYQSSAVASRDEYAFWQIITGSVALHFRCEPFSYPRRVDPAVPGAAHIPPRGRCQGQTFSRYGVIRADIIQPEDVCCTLNVLGDTSRQNYCACLMWNIRHFHHVKGGWQMIGQKMRPIIRSMMSHVNENTIFMSLLDRSKPPRQAIPPAGENRKMDRPLLKFNLSPMNVHLRKINMLAGRCNPIEKVRPWCYKPIRRHVIVGLIPVKCLCCPAHICLFFQVHSQGNPGLLSRAIIRPAAAVRG